MTERGEPWSVEEVRAAIADYFAMFRLHLEGAPLNKAERYRALAARFPARTAKSFEWKAQNISAALLDGGRPALAGLAPAFNRQAIIDAEVETFLAAHPEFGDLFRDTAERPASDALATLPSAEDMARSIGAVEVAAPARLRSRPATRPVVASRGPRTGTDWLGMEARNASLGRAGEEFALRYEIARLLAAGREALAGKVEHVSRTRGDGLGFDILSREPDGADRLVEVKTTAYAAETPFYVTRNELDVSTAEADRYHVLRVFDFPRANVAPRRRRWPRLFTLSGQIDRSCDLSPTEYRAIPR